MRGRGDVGGDVGRTGTDLQAKQRATTEDALTKLAAFVASRDGVDLAAMFRRYACFVICLSDNLTVAAP